MKPEQLQEGVLCQLKTGRWDASKRMDKRKLGEEIPQEIVRAMQDLIEDRTLLKDLATVRRSAKGLLQRNSLAFPIDGVMWVKKEKINFLDEEFKDFKKENDKRLEKFIKHYDKMKKDFKKKYPDYYDERNYPSKARLRQKFYFDWNFFQISIPDKSTKILSPAVYKRETEKLRNMVNQMEEMTINLIGNMLHRRVVKLSGQCDSGKINAGTVNSIERFMKRWDELWRDHVDDRKMKMVMTRLKKEMKSASAERLKNNEDFREKMGSSLETIMEKLHQVPDFELKRKLDV
jgi:hypothetical protein